MKQILRQCRPEVATLSRLYSTQKSENHYDTLRVKSNASQKEIRNAFLKLSKEHHPDSGGKSQDFVKINEAYTVLGKSATRDYYDWSLKNHQAPGQAPGGYPGQTGYPGDNPGGYYGGPLHRRDSRHQHYYKDYYESQQGWQEPRRQGGFSIYSGVLIVVVFYFLLGAHHLYAMFQLRQKSNAESEYLARQFARIKAEATMRDKLQQQQFMDKLKSERKDS